MPDLDRRRGRVFFADLRATVSPGRGAEHGLLPPLLLTLTFVTGLVDAFSYLVLGHVFVANMTGNVVFLGFALAGAPGFSIDASLVALAAFWCGALAGGRMGSGLSNQRTRLLAASATAEAVLLAVAVVIEVLAPAVLTSAFRYALIVTLAPAMGLQNATARKLAVPDLTTTVLTLTITGTAADSSLAGGRGSAAGRRLVAVVAMLLGALVGAALVVSGQHVVPLALGLAALIVIALAAPRALGMAEA